MLPTLTPRHGRALVSAALLAALALAAAPLAAAPFDGGRAAFADPRFERVWARTDDARVRGGRSWYWGPGPWFDYAEFYRESPAGLRSVQYFDKARMEINRPADGIVTNGLLVKELVGGRLQLGDNPFDMEQRAAADVPVAGNPRVANSSGPGYGAFAGVTTLDNGYRDPQRIGERVAVTIDRAGNLGLRPELARAETTIVQYNSVTGHNIPQVFWDFMNLQGPIIPDGAAVGSGPVVDWLFAMGYPISDPYWTRATVGGAERDVLVQLFERRVLTYTPANPAGYQVEMGNVGQHYFQWRYPHLGLPWDASDPVTPLLYASNIDAGGHWELYLPNYAGGGIRISRNSAETVAFSWRRSWDPAQQQLLVDSRRSNPSYRQIYALDPVAFYSGDFAPGARVTRISYSDGTPPPPSLFPGHLPSGAASDSNPSVSPDGTKILFISDRTGAPELFLAPFSGHAPIQLTSQGCANETPSWSPDGRRIYWASSCDGDYDIYSAALFYYQDGQSGIFAELRDVRNLTNNAAVNDRFARLSPDGRSIAFASDREGDWEIYIINASDGGAERRMTTSFGTDDAPTWSPDGRLLAFASDRDGDFEIYTMDIRYANVVTQLTSNSAADRWPLWAQ